MIHSFDTKLAKDHGLSEAVFMHNVYFWTQLNLSHRKHIHDGLCWTYNTMESFSELLPYFTVKQIEHLINKLVKKGLLIKGNYNRVKYDRTRWYAMTPAAYKYYKELLTDQYMIIMNSSFASNGEKSPYFPISEISEMEILNSGNGNPEFRRPIPDSKTDIKNTDVKEGAEAASPPKSKSSQIDEDFEPNDSCIKLAMENNVSISKELPAFIDYYKGIGKPMRDWQATFRNWIRKSAKFASKPSYSTRNPLKQPGDVNAAMDIARRLSESSTH